MFLGVDGAHKNWCCCIIDENLANFQIEVFKDINELYTNIPHFDQLFIDIPIGLSSKSFSRIIDSEVRRFLPKNRKSSVFTPPCREALNEQNYKAANLCNKSITGKGISIQSWNLSNRILEIDLFLRTHQNLLFKIHESHPELCFFMLNNQQSLLYSKKQTDGVLERVRIILRYLKVSEIDFIDNIHVESKIKGIKIDDILDAISLSISAFFWKKNNKRSIFQDNNDACDIPLKIAY